MIMNGKTIRKRLDSLYEKAPGIALGAKDKWVVFSDLHLGDGGAGDDFRINDDLFSHVLEKHYGPENFSLILNGDVEELLRYRRQAITHAWKRIYRILEIFQQQKRLMKIFGNHDYELHLPKRRPRRIPVQETVKLDFRGWTIFVLHGHQASWFLELFRFLVIVSLRFLARPLRIRNYSVARSSRKKFAVERAIRETGCTIAPSLWFPACSIRDAPSAKKGSPPSRLMRAASAWFIGQTEIGTHARLRAVGPRPRLRTRPPFSGWFCRKKLLIISSLESGFSRSLTP